MGEAKMAVTFRLSADQAEGLAIVASVEGKSVSEVIRAAIAEHIDALWRDEQFRTALRRRADVLLKIANGGDVRDP